MCLPVLVYTAGLDEWARKLRRPMSSASNSRVAGIVLHTSSLQQHELDSVSSYQLDGLEEPRRTETEI